MESIGVPFLVSAALPLVICLFFLPAILKNTFTSRSVLNGIPGPFLARFTNLWRFWMVYKGHADREVLKLHKRYGKIVRIGPNCVSLGDIDTIKRVYSSKGVTKSDMYHPASFVQDGKVVETLFSTQDEAAHSYMVRPIARLYTTAGILKYENHFDSALEDFCLELDKRFASTRATCGIDEWLSFYAWDVIGQLTFSESFGIMEQGKDTLGIINTNDRIMDYNAWVGQMPILDRFLDKNPIFRIGPPTATVAAGFSAERLFKRMAEREKDHDFKHRDMMDSFVAIKKVNPELPDPLVISWVMMNVLAGSDTTRCTLLAAVYFVLKDRRIHSKLQQELDEANIQLPVKWKTLHSLPYLGAVVREALRIHPPVGVNLERVLPQTLTLPDGQSFPPGTILGISTWAASRDSAYGEKVDEFIPERWLKREGESDKEFDVRLGAMNAADLVFGFGKRACYGKPIALLLINKTIAALFATYNMSLVDPEKEWSTRANFFVLQKGVSIRVERRGASNSGHTL